MHQGRRGDDAYWDNPRLRERVVTTGTADEVIGQQRERHPDEHGADPADAQRPGRDHREHRGEREGEDHDPVHRGANAARERHQDFADEGEQGLVGDAVGVVVLHERSGQPRSVLVPA